MESTATEYLNPTYFLDYTSESVRRFTAKHCNLGGDPKEKAIQLYYAVRDTIRYDPYDVQPLPESMRASSVVTKGSGYCVAKAVLLTAAARAASIPARLGFADVTNHLTTERLRKLMGTDVFVYHGYSEFLLENGWVKATPAFNRSLCDKFGVLPLEFDGSNDCLFHQYDAKGRLHMEYLRDHGHYNDLPFSRIFAAYARDYPGMFNHLAEVEPGDFTEEAGKSSEPSP